MEDKERPRGSVNIEEVTEETYSDLLPYEMERAEAALKIMVPFHRKPMWSAKDTAAKQMSHEITSSIVRAKMSRKNRWGHEWRSSPDAEPPREEGGGIIEAAGMSPYIKVALGHDPICAKLKEERLAALMDESDNIPATD